MDQIGVAITQKTLLSGSNARTPLALLKHVSPCLHCSFLAFLLYIFSCLNWLLKSIWKVKHNSGCCSFFGSDWFECGLYRAWSQIELIRLDDGCRLLKGSSLSNVLGFLYIECTLKWAWDQWSWMLPSPGLKRDCLARKYSDAQERQDNAQCNLSRSEELC